MNLHNYLHFIQGSIKIYNITPTFIYTYSYKEFGRIGFDDTLANKYSLPFQTLQCISINIVFICVFITET